MTTADRIDPDLNRAWKQALVPVGAQSWPGTDAPVYRGKHRSHAGGPKRHFSLRGLFYLAKHRHR